jgi:formylglycine-generating enzyme
MAFGCTGLNDIWWYVFKAVHSVASIFKIKKHFMRKANTIKFPLIILLLLTIAMLLFPYKSIQSREHIKVEGMVFVKGGKLSAEDPETKQLKQFGIKSFLIDKNLVTVAEFNAFVKATGYKTEAQQFGNAGVFDKNISNWQLIDGANYQYPFGKNGGAAKPDHPVTQVSWNDAQAYAKWNGKRLPTQWEWEFAARDGKNENKVYAWGDNLIEKGKYKANTWQGSFPYHNTIEDGYEYTSPVGTFGENKNGLTDMGGNVWQWCSDSIAPTQQEAALDPATRRVLRGGSYFCDPQVCHGYTLRGRSSCTPETALAHIGFRCAKDF